MKKLLFLASLAVSLFSSEILNYNIYNRTDRVDIMLTFDTPYQDKIKEQQTSKNIVITLEGALMQNPKFQTISSNIIKAIKIIPLEDSTQIIVKKSTSNVKMIAAKTKDSYGLRLRFKSRVASTQMQSDAQDPFAALPTKKDTPISANYIIVVTLLFIGVIVLFFINKKIRAKISKTPAQDSWLFKAASSLQQQKIQPTKQQQNTMEPTIKFQKQIDEHNSVVLIEYGSRSYLALSGNSNALLDKFEDNKPTTQEEFEYILHQRDQELDDFLKVANTTNLQTKEDILQEYKTKAATLSYEENL